MPRVSVLLTCFNHLPYLPAALESVRAQTFRDFEVVVLDDGSSDGTREWLEEHAGDCRLIFNSRNMGTYATLNVGLEQTSGEFVAIINDDDLWEPKKLEQQVALLDTHSEVGLCHTDGTFIDAEGRRIEGSPLGFDFPRMETGDARLPLLYANKIIASAAVVRRRCFEEVGAFNPAYFGSGDWEMWLRVAERWNIGYVFEELTRYRVHGGNASHRLERIWRDDERLREWIAERAPRYSGLDAHDLQRALSHNWACLGTVRTLNGDPRGGRRAYRESLRLQPGRFKSVLRYLATFLPRPAFRALLRA